MTGRPADPLAVIRGAIRPNDYDDTPYNMADVHDALAAVERLVEAARPMANLPAPVSADERQQWIIRQNQLRDVLALFDGGEA